MCVPINREFVVMALFGSESFYFWISKTSCSIYVNFTPQCYIVNPEVKNIRRQGRFVSFRLIVFYRLCNCFVLSKDAVVVSSFLPRMYQKMSILFL